MNIVAFFEFTTSEIMLVVILILAFPLLCLFCLIDIIRSDFKDSTAKLIWVLVVLFAPFIGSVLYLFIGRKSKVINT
ncbi:PLDc N-terminal domain-containing protein [Mucilaginibacter sp. UR6-11]|uniref:PLDc N-terminal domain-containing protein n=1 Tax=Mucilaginibacter sp. UR6-11 TaxID=1435644 RepID=UPI001E42C944|nr:PLD nuclease N-terminal domain-containing protein [Mucilaginibacter sp. UR6-11]MCC8426143.1 PLD nuclease N-terminal domain-containing protein [Mucilaginibacter sp. UR6-11]